MDVPTIAAITYTLAILIGGIGAWLIDEKVRRDGEAAVRTDGLGARLLLRACPLALAAATLITLGAALRAA